MAQKEVTRTAQTKQGSLFTDHQTQGPEHLTNPSGLIMTNDMASGGKKQGAHAT